MPPLEITRRTLIRSAGLTATALALPRSVMRRAMGEADGFRLIRARAFRGEDASAEPDWRYDAVLPGPLLRLKQGEEVKVRLLNELSGPTSLHWHGLRLPNPMDGTALTQQPVAAGASFDYRFTPPDAGTFWYHPPARTALSHTLYGLLIVDEAQPIDVDRDVALIVDHARGSFTANALSALDIPVRSNERLRLRLLNAAPDRLVALRLDRHPMMVIAIDGQPAEPFMPRDGRVTLSPGNRLDLLVDCVREEGSSEPIVVQSDDADAPLARLVYDSGVPARPAPRTDVKPLPANPLPARMDFRGAQRAELAVDAGSSTPAAKPLVAVKRGRTVMLAFANRSAAPHVVHIHGHSVRLLDNLDDGWKPFWLDTILCVPQRTTRVAFVADNPGKWPISSRTLGGDETLTWFQVS
jgi:FtsP/CotA-like multicopper oxidase with cupredoxin domain